MIGGKLVTFFVLVFSVTCNQGNEAPRESVSYEGNAFVTTNYARHVRLHARAHFLF